MRLLIDLQDDNGTSYGLKKWSFDENATVDQLELAIESLFQIDPNDQMIFFNSTQLHFGTLVALGVKHESTVVLKHCLLEVWSTYLALCTRFNNTRNTKSLRIELAHEAIDCREQLKNSTFFKVYARLRVRLADSIGPMMRFVDRTENALQKTATRFFSEKFPNSKIDFEAKRGGTRAGIIASVVHNDKETNYYMKTYHHAGSSMSLQSTSKQHLLDLREMFAYRLLEVIGVGPVVFFPFYTGSTIIPYIATEEVSEFQELDKIDNTTLSEKIVVEAYLLSLILGIRDLNEGNIGTSKDGTLAIVDFYVPENESFLRNNIVTAFKDISRFAGVGKGIEVLIEVKPDERVRIAKSALPRWSRIRTITSEIISTEKSELQQHGIKFGTATNDVDSYISDIKENYDSICRSLE